MGSRMTRRARAQPCPSAARRALVFTPRLLWPKPSSSFRQDTPQADTFAGVLRFRIILLRNMAIHFRIDAEERDDGGNDGGRRGRRDAAGAWGVDTLWPAGRPERSSVQRGA